jgi:hypothetical protein
MKSIVAITSLLLVGATTGIGCGSKPPPAPDAPAPAASAAPADSSSTTSTTAPGAAAPSASTASSGDAPVSVDSQREPFMQGCMKKVPSPDYCDCGFQQFRQLFSGSDMAKTQDDDPRFAQLQQATMQACASKLPEDTVKTSFLTGCTGGEPKKAAYCACAWPALRKTLSIADFIGDFQGQRFDDAKSAMVKTCKGKFPTSVAKGEFMGACTKGDASAAGHCGCIWKKLTAKYSTEQIAAGMADVQSTPGVDTCK